MYDLHSHILPALDDGAATLAESVAIGRAAAGEGVRAIAATPHVRTDYPTTPDAMETGVLATREALAAEHVEVDVLPGGEIALDQLPAHTPAELHRFGLAGNPGVLLVEFPYDGWPVDLAQQLRPLFELGIRPVLAHPERNPLVQSAPNRLSGLVSEGALVQVTASSITGAAGRSTERAARQLIDSGMAHMLASDAHGHSVRRSGLSKARAALRNDVLGRWMTEDVPRAIVRGDDIPPAPITRRSGGLLRRLRG